MVVNRQEKVAFLLLAFGEAGLLCTVFATDIHLANGLVTGKVHWFHWAMLLLGVCSLLAVMLSERVRRFHFSVADGLVCALTGIVALTYDWQLDPEPEKMLFGGQLVILWFLLRLLFTGWPQSKILFLIMITGTGWIEAIEGMRQLHGWEASHHSLFKLTGDFYNPGPYSGYLAMVLPVCLWMILRPVKRWIYYWGWGCLLAIVIVLPAGMSRTAWIAASVSCAWVYWIERIGWKKTKQYIYQNRALSILLSILILVSVTGAGIGVYLLKKDSAHGRLLLWKVTEQAIARQPLTGTGLGGFPAAYAESQAIYLASEEVSEIEKRVAGCPEYGFNEFLQIGLEQGLPALALFVGLLIRSLWRGTGNRQVGAAGGILALMIFSLASYPLQLPEFWVLLVVLMGIVECSPVEIAPVSSCKERKVLSIAIVGGLMVCCGYLFGQQKKYYPGYKRWNALKMLYNNKAYKTAVDGYVELVPLLGHKPELLFEAAQCLSKEGQFDDANRLLERAMRLSSDPMIHYMAAKNEQSRGNYLEAERLLLHAIDILPERIYPYYLLTKLYAEESFFQKDKFLEAADSVLKKDPKVESSAIQEMKMNVKNMLKNMH